MSNKILSTVFIFSVLALASCAPNNGITCKTAICTQNFAMMTVKITMLNLPAQAPTIDVYDSNSNAFVHQNVEENYNTKQHELLSDSDMSWIAHSNTPEKFRVDVKVGNTVIKSYAYSFQKDCCHIGKVSGADSLFVP
jgi:hypothetical protein